jgi:hypothetical protein
LAAPKADAADGCGAAGFASPKAPPDDLAKADDAAIGGEIGRDIGRDCAAGFSEFCAATSCVLPSLPITKLVLHFGQRIFMPVAGMRRSSTSYGDLHETHSTLIMDDRTVAPEP